MQGGKDTFNTRIFFFVAETTPPNGVALAMLFVAVKGGFPLVAMLWERQGWVSVGALLWERQGWVSLGALL